MIKYLAAFSVTLIALILLTPVYGVSIKCSFSSEVLTSNIESCKNVESFSSTRGVFNVGLERESRMRRFFILDFDHKVYNFNYADDQGCTFSGIGKFYQDQLYLVQLDKKSGKNCSEGIDGRTSFLDSKINKMKSMWLIIFA